MLLVTGILQKFPSFGRLESVRRKNEIPTFDDPETSRVINKLIKLTILIKF